MPTEDYSGFPGYCDYLGNISSRQIKKQESRTRLVWPPLRPRLH